MLWRDWLPNVMRRMLAGEQLKKNREFAAVLLKKLLAKIRSWLSRKELMLRTRNIEKKTLKSKRWLPKEMLGRQSRSDREMLKSQSVRPKRFKTRLNLSASAKNERFAARNWKS